MGVEREPPRSNNFDGLRLLAALQVALFHGWEHLKISEQHPELAGIVNVARHVPGVPVFFVLSGFLIPWAWSRNRSPRQYARNRFLRMYPAMWVAFGVSFAVMAAQGIITTDVLRKGSTLAWIVGQLSLAQFYTAPDLRVYGLGNPNGSLWTIVIELQFYLLVPFLMTTSKGSRRRTNVLLTIFFLASLTANFVIGRMGHASTVAKLLGVTLAPFLFYFLIGTFVWTNWEQLGRLLVGQGTRFATAFVLYSLLFGEVLHYYAPSYWPSSAFGLGAILLLGLTTLALGFSGNASNALLAHNDLSYGVYLYHCIVLNVLVQHQWMSLMSLGLLIVSSVLLAGASWVLVERPALARKQRIVAEARAVRVAPDPDTG